MCDLERAGASLVRGLALTRSDRGSESISACRQASRIADQMRRVGIVTVTRHEVAADLQAIMVGQGIRGDGKIAGLLNVQHLNLYLVLPEPRRLRRLKT